MPSPLAHLAAATLVMKKSGGRFRGNVFPVKVMLVCMFFSIAPDLDAVVGILAGDMARFHNNMSHSPVFGFVVSVIAAPIVCLFLEKRWSVGRVLILILICYHLHLLMDWLTWGRGLMLLWPFAETRFASHLPVFYGVRWSNGVWSMTHLITIANELLVIGAVTFFNLKKQRPNKDQ